MKIKPYLDKLNGSSEYKKFKEKYKDSFLVAGFFVLDLELGKNIHQIDYYIPSKKKFAAFSLDEGVHMQILDALGDKVPEELDMNTNIDLDAIHGILEDEMKNRNITEEIRKIIVVLQNVNGKKIWNINSVLSGMEILKAHVEDSTQTVLKMEKTSFVEIMKKMPAAEQASMQPQVDSPSEEMSQGAQTPDEALDEMKKLDKLEEAIEKEKARLKKDLIETEKKSKKTQTKSDKTNKVAKKIVSI